MGRQKSTAKTRLAKVCIISGGGLTLSGGGRYTTYSIYVLICLFVIWYRGIPHYARACAISQTCLQKRRPKDLAGPVSRA